MQVLIDVNLPPQWEGHLKEEEFEAVHWSSVGERDAPDRVLMKWAKQNGYVVLTHDLDFSAILAVTQAEGPSVVQLRTDDVLPDASGNVVCRALRQFESELEEGAILSVDVDHFRVRYLPLSE